jgi:3-demethoxyubiquinol 3-hydroxylase
MQHYSFLDKIIICFDKTWHLTQKGPRACRPNPADQVSEADLNPRERRHAAGLMRINHVGEVCAQALYQGQALTARSIEIEKKLQHAALEEIDHLAWCQQRLTELNARPSYLNPFWYFGSWLMGVLAGTISDRISLGFLAETEQQVAAHLATHLEKLPLQDKKSRAIVTQMRLEELQHAHTAEQAGAAVLPIFVRRSMHFLAELMKWWAYRI